MIQIKNITPKLLNASILCIMAILCLRDIFDLDIGGAAITGVIAVLLIILPYPHLIYLLFFILPLTCGIPGYVMLLSIIILLLKSKHKTALQIIPVLVISLVEIFHASFYDFNADLKGILSYLSFTAVFFFLLFDQNKTIDRRICIKYFCLGAVFTLMIIYADLILKNGFTEIITGNLRSGFAMGIDDVEEMKNHLALNANSIAYYSIVSLGCLLLGRKKLQLSLPLYLLLTCAAIAAGVLSFSRTWLLLIAIISILFIITNKLSNKFITMATIAIIVSLAIMSDSAFFSPITENITNRIENDNIATAGGRVTIFKEYNRFWSSDIKYMLFGTGAVYYKEVARQSASMHNGIQQIYVCYGVCGIILYITVIFIFIRKYRQKGLPLLYYLPIIACFLFDQSIQFLNPYYLMLPFIPAAYALRIENPEI